MMLQSKRALLTRTPTTTLWRRPMTSPKTTRTSFAISVGRRRDHKRGDNVIGRLGWNLYDVYTVWHRVLMLEASSPFDQEHRLNETRRGKDRMKIGIVGFGTFGQFLAKRFMRAGHEVTATSRQDRTDDAIGMGVHFFRDANDFAEDHPDVVIISTSIISLERVVDAFPFHRLRRSTLVVDVLSVKVFPKRLLLKKIPEELDILCTHPMFGPDSGKASWDGLPFMYEYVRVGDDPQRKERVDNFVGLFRREGCTMLEMSCEEHDKKTASTQFITHTVGRVLGAMNLTQTALDTKGFQSLRTLVDNTSHDSFDLYYGLFMYNQNATEEIDRLERAFEEVKKQLFDRLHAVARHRLFHEMSDPLRSNAFQQQTVDNKAGQSEDTKAEVFET